MSISSSSSSEPRASKFSSSGVSSFPCSLKNASSAARMLLLILSQHFLPSIGSRPSLMLTSLSAFPSHVSSMRCSWSTAPSLILHEAQMARMATSAEGRPTILFHATELVREAERCLVLAAAEEEEELEEEAAAAAVALLVASVT